jgi:catechol 2,3-dioxygenase-like lactoylglutathione lyase family enzyme
MNAWEQAEKAIGAITLFVEDVGRAQSFYRDVLGLPVDHEDAESASFRFGDTVIRLEDITSSATNIAPAQVAGPHAGSRFELTIFVDDVGGICSELAERGVKMINGPIDQVWGMRTACFADPGGHLWELSGPIPQADGS